MLEEDKQTEPLFSHSLNDLATHFNIRHKSFDKSNSLSPEFSFAKLNTITPYLLAFNCRSKLEHTSQLPPIESVLKSLNPKSVKARSEMKNEIRSPKKMCLRICKGID